MNWITPFHLAPSDRQHTRAIHMALVRDLYRRDQMPVLIHLGALGVFYAILREPVAALPWARVLVAGLVVLTLGRVVLAFMGSRLEVALRRPNTRFLLFSGLAALSGILTGATVMVVMGNLDAGHFLLLCLYLLGMAALSCLAMAGSPYSFLAYALPPLASLVLAGMLHSTFGMGSLFSVAVLVFAIGLAAIAVQVHHSLFSTVLLTQRLEDLALRDPLTGLRNRRYLQEFMQEETPRVLRRWLAQDGATVSRRSISLILVDLDHFKHVNDDYGHNAGDAVLIQVSQLLKDIVRKPDLVLRWGGEEFLILALDSDRISPPQIAVRVHEHMAQHAFVLPGGQKIRQTCSVGYAIFPFHPERPEGLGWEQVFRMADESLYGAKDKGRNLLQGVLPGEGDPDAIIAALEVPDPDFPGALKAGLIRMV